MYKSTKREKVENKRRVGQKGKLNYALNESSFYILNINIFMAITWSTFLLTTGSKKFAKLLKIKVAEIESNLK